MFLPVLLRFIHLAVCRSVRSTYYVGNLSVISRRRHRIVLFSPALNHKPSPLLALSRSLSLCPSSSSSYSSSPSLNDLFIEASLDTPPRHLQASNSTQACTFVHRASELQSFGTSTFHSRIAPPRLRSFMPPYSNSSTSTADRAPIVTLKNTDSSSLHCA